MERDNPVAQMDPKEILYQNDPRFRVKPYQQIAASCTGACITSLIMTPLDVVKIRLQAQQISVSSNKQLDFCSRLVGKFAPDHICSCFGEDQWYHRHRHFSGTMDAMIKIARIEGLNSLWSGLSPAMVLAVPSTVLYFTTYEQLRTRLNDRYGKLNEQPLWVPLISGLSARLIAATCVSPLELIRTKMQSKKLSYLDMHGVIRSLIQEHGYRGLWKGLLPTLCRDAPFSGIYWVCYESLKSNYYETKISFWFSFLAGSISGTLAAVLTTPFDVVKTHQQINLANQICKVEQKPVAVQLETSMMTLFRSIYESRGVRGLYAGLVPRVTKIAPACAVMVSTFEYGKHFFEVRNMNEYRRIQNL